eukprot:1574273-Alexandrium_andersonii.AAC.1
MAHTMCDQSQLHCVLPVYFSACVLAQRKRETLQDNPTPAWHCDAWLKGTSCGGAHQNCH